MTSRLIVNSIRHTGGSADAVTLASDGTCTASITNNLSNRNKVINGAMTVSQRGTSFTASGTASGYGIDRFQENFSMDGGYTLTQSTTSPDGFANSMKIDVTSADTSLAAGQFVEIKHKIEAQDLQDLAFGTSAAKTVVLSFYVRSNKTGNYAFAIQQSDNSFKQASFQYAISSADTWERKTIVIAGDTSGVINNDTGDGFILMWALAAGSNLTGGSLRSTFTTRVAADQYAGQGVNLLDSTSNEWYITGVQLEVDHTGSGKPTDFEHRSFGQELALCQRYYYVIADGSELADQHIGNGFGWSSSQVECAIRFPVVMRGNPSLLLSTGTNYYMWRSNGSQIYVTNVALTNANPRSASIFANSSMSVSGAVANGSYRTQLGNASAYLHLNAEL